MHERFLLLPRSDQHFWSASRGTCSHYPSRPFGYASDVRADGKAARLPCSVAASNGASANNTIDKQNTRLSFLARRSFSRHLASVDTTATHISTSPACDIYGNRTNSRRQSNGASILSIFHVHDIDCGRLRPAPA